jgi:hypothetical protein
MEQIFDLCVQLLILLGHITGLGYVGINVIIFCIIEPIVFVLMTYVIYRQWKKIKMLKAMA